MVQAAKQTTRKPKFPGWRTMTASQRRNAQYDRIWEEARRLGAFDEPKPVAPVQTTA